MTYSTVKNITIAGPFHDACGFITAFADVVSHYEDHPRVYYTTRVTGPYRVESMISFISDDDETFQIACMMAEQSPTLHCTLTPASGVKLTPELMSRMRRGNGVIEFVATEDRSPHNPMNDMTEEEKSRYFMEVLGLTDHPLLNIKETGIPD